MAISYNDWKKQYEALDSAGKQKYADLTKNSALWQQYMNQYTQEITPVNNYTVNNNTTSTTTPVNNTRTTGTNNKTSWTNQNTQNIQNNQNTQNTQTNWTSGVNQWGVQNNSSAWYNQVKPNEVSTRTNATSAEVHDLGYQWDKLTYAQQQEKLNQTPALRQSLQNLGIRIKWPNDNVGWTTWTSGTTWTGNQWGNQWGNEWGNFVPWSEWDYQDNSQARMDQIADNLNRYRVTNPDLFESEDAFYNFFIRDKGRSQDQIDYLWSYYNNVQKYWKYDTLSAAEIWAWLVDGSIPQDYLNWLKATDPAKYSWVGTAMKDKQDEIMNESYLNTVIEEAWLGSQISNDYSDMTKWAIKNWLLVDKNGDWIDDGLYVEPSDEEKQLWKEDSEYEAEKLKLKNAMKDLQSDLTDQYPDADLSTIMLLTADRGQKIQKSLDTLAVSQTRTQWELKYMQNERALQSDARQKTISSLQKAYGMYYDYSPEWIAERYQAQYAAQNVTLDQADNGTDTQKQMALEQVLTPLYEKYWSIIERSQWQVINDVMALAKSKGISLKDALEENFMQYLRAKPWFKQLNTITSNNPDITRIGTDSDGNPVYWYWKDWKLISIDWITWTWEWGMRTERNNNPTAMITAYAKQLWWVEWVDYVQWDWWTNDEWKTYYTAKLIGDPIEKTIELLDRWVANNVKQNVFTAWSYRKDLWMNNEKWSKLSHEEKQNVVLKMLQHEWWDISKMAYYNQPNVSESWYNPDLVSLFDEFNTVWDDQLNQKRFRENNKWTLKKYWIDVDEFKKQYKEWYALTTKDAFSDVLKNLDLLIEATWPDFSVDEETAAMLWLWDVWTAYDLIKQNATVNWLADAKARWLKLWVLSDSDVRMIAKASSSFNYTNSDKKWNRELMDFRNQILSKNKYLAQEYANKSTYSPNTTFSYDPETNKITVTKWKATATNNWGSTKKNIKDLGNK